MRCVALCLFALSLAVSGAAETVWIPVVAHSPGVGGTSWRSDLAIVNVCDIPVDVTLRFRTGTGDHVASFEIASARQQLFPDVVTTFTDDDTFGSLEIESDGNLGVTSRTYNVGQGTFGQSLDGFRPADGLDTGETGHLQQLQENESFRSNIGFLNMGDSDATLLISLFDRLGNEVGSFEASVPAGRTVQEGRPFLSRFGRSDILAGRATVHVQAGGPVFAYASVVDAKTGDPTTVVMRQIGCDSEPTGHPWPMFQGGPEHRGSAAVQGPASANLKWRFEVGTGATRPTSPAVHSDGTIFIGGPTTLFALDDTGAIQWSVPCEVCRGPALADDGTRLFVISRDTLRAHATANGELLWSFAFEDQSLFGVTLASNGNLYQGSWDGRLYAISPEGEELWNYQTDGCIAYPPSIAGDGTIYLGGGDAHCGGDPHLYAFTPDGDLSWRYDTGQLRVGTPSLGRDGLIYAVSNGLLVFDDDGNLAWSLDDVAGIISAAIAADGTVMVGNTDGVVRAIDPQTRSVLWSYSTGADPDQPNFYGVIGFPVVDRDGTTFVGAVDWKMHAIDRNGNAVWTYETGGRITESSPAFGADGTLYFTSDDGYLYAIGD